MFPSVPWLRCQFHLKHNSQGYVSKIDQRKVVARQIRSIFSAPDVHEATRLLNIAQGFAVFALPPEHRVRMRTTNGLERINKELKRSARVATLFPNTASCLRLVSAMLAEQDEEWMTAKIYLTMKP